MKERVTRLEYGITQAPRPTPLLLPPQDATDTAHVLAVSSGIDGDKPLGIAQVGGKETVITANYFFGMIRDLQAKVDILTERSKNTGVIFQHLAFSSEAEFALWYTQP